MRNQIENELITRPVFFRCVDDSNDTVMLTDTNGQLFYVNKAWQRVYGYSTEEILGKTPGILRSRHQDSAFYKKMWSEILDPQRGYWRGELINLSKDGREVPVFLTISPFRNERGEVEGYMGIAVDISEKKRLEAQIQHQDRLANIGLIASGLAHEIGTPLGVVRGRAEYLSMIYGQDEVLKNNLEIVVTQIDRISKLIYSLLHLSRTSTQEDLKQVGVEEVLNEVLLLLSQKMTKLHVTPVVNIQPKSVVIADSSKLEQVLLNLLMNALQAIEIAHKQGKTENHKIEVSTVVNQNRCTITILDTGIGISKENLSKIFRPFFTTKDIGVGTGLGLAITEQIIRSWGGDISVESQEGIGTQFKVSLPASVPNSPGDSSVTQPYSRSLR